MRGAGGDEECDAAFGMAIAMIGVRDENALVKWLAGATVDETEDANLEERHRVFKEEIRGESITWITPFNGRNRLQVSISARVEPLHAIFTVAPALSLASLLPRVGCTSVVLRSHMVACIGQPEHVCDTCMQDKKDGFSGISSIIGSAHSPSEPPNAEDSGTLTLLRLGSHFDGFADVERNKWGLHLDRLLYVATGQVQAPAHRSTC